MVATSHPQAALTAIEVLRSGGTAADAARRGAGVLVISDDLDDLRPCDRVIVLFKGEVVTELERGWHDHELIAAMEGLEGSGE